MKKNTKIFWTFIVLLFLVLSVNAKDIELFTSPDSANVNAGSTATFTLTIKNNQEVSEGISILLAGEAATWASSSRDKFTISAGGTENVVLRVTPPANTLTGTYILKVSASNLKDKWDIKDIKISVLGTKTSGISISEKVALSPVGALPTYLDFGNVRLNLYFNPKLIVGDYILKNGDEVCVGDSFKLQQNSVGGDWWDDGGPVDSPPVYIVPDLGQAIWQISQRAFDAPTYQAYICYFNGYCSRDCPKPYEPKGGCPIGCGPRCTVDGTLVCSPICETNSKGVELGKTENEFIISKEGEISADIQCTLQCIFFVKKCPLFDDAEHSLKTYGFLATNPDTWEFSVNLSLKAVKNEIKPQLKILDSKMSKVNAAYAIRAIVKNSGENTAKIDKISLNLPEYKILYAPKVLSPSEESEIIIEINPVILENFLEDIKITFEYRADKLGCLSSKEFKETITLSGLTNFPLIKSVQVYKMIVEGDCKNEYYACASPNKEGKFYVGYQCNNKDPYFVTSAERVNLMFDLSSLPENANVLSAKLFLPVEAVNEPLTISIFEIDDFDQKNCEPGGDICTQPYCKECSPSFELQGKLIETKKISMPGSYSFDISKIVKNKKLIAFQVQGSNENKWAEKAESSCTKPKEWDHYDLQLSKPYLKILFT
ncbi:MAG: hypothetical protein QXY62_01015 [Candidatus Altiarchaeota archaeon]